jgi:hypothetical protein
MSYLPTLIALVFFNFLHLGMLLLLVWASR